MLINRFVGIGSDFPARPAIVQVEIVLLIVEHLRPRRILAIVLKEPVLLRRKPRENLIFDGFAERFVGFRVVRRSVVLAEGAAVRANLEFLFGTDDVAAFSAVKENGVNCTHAMACRFGWWGSGEEKVRMTSDLVAVEKGAGAAEGSSFFEGAEVFFWDEVFFAGSEEELGLGYGITEQIEVYRLLSFIGRRTYRIFLGV